MAAAIGKSAVLLLPVMRTVPLLGFPLFVLLAACGMARYLAEMLTRPDAEDLQDIVTNTFCATSCRRRG